MKQTPLSQFKGMSIIVEIKEHETSATLFLVRKKIVMHDGAVSFLFLIWSRTQAQGMVVVTFKGLPQPQLL